jgi:hypothetical protein
VQHGQSIITIKGATSRACCSANDTEMQSYRTCRCTSLVLIKLRKLWVLAGQINWLYEFVFWPTDNEVE